MDWGKIMQGILAGAGTAIGALGGPVGAAAGGAIGATLGGMAGQAIDGDGEDTPANAMQSQIGQKAYTPTPTPQQPQTTLAGQLGIPGMQHLQSAQGGDTMDPQKQAARLYLQRRYGGQA